MTIDHIKQELKEMRATAERCKTEDHEQKFKMGMDVGYIRAIEDLERFINQREYLENIREARG